jgi:hypothetical protein
MVLKNATRLLNAVTQFLDHDNLYNMLLVKYAHDSFTAIGLEVINFLNSYQLYQRF